MTLFSEVLRAVDEFERGSFQLDEFDCSGEPRVTVFFNDSRTARMVQSFLSNAQQQLPESLRYDVYRSGLQVALLQRGGSHSEKINPLFAQQMRKAIDSFKAFLLSPWERSSAAVPGKVCYSKEHGFFTDVLYRHLQSTPEIKNKVTRSEDGFTADSIVGKEEEINAFFQRLREEMELRSPEEEKKQGSPVEEGFTRLRCAADVALFRGKAVAYQTMFGNKLSFGRITRDPVKWAGSKIGFQLRKAHNESEARSVTALTNAYFNEPIFMREATEQEIAEKVDGINRSGSPMLENPVDPDNL